MIWLYVKRNGINQLVTLYKPLDTVSSLIKWKVVQTHPLDFSSHIQGTWYSCKKLRSHFICRSVFLYGGRGIWQYLQTLLVVMTGEGLLVSSRYRSGVLLTMPQWAGQLLLPPIKNYLAQNVQSARAEKFCSRPESLYIQFLLTE